MRSRLFAGLFSLFLIGLIIVGPVWLAEKLEKVETSRSDLRSFSEVRESSTLMWDNETVTVYTPYLQYESDTFCEIEWTPGLVSGPFFREVGQTPNVGHNVFDVDGYQDALYSTIEISSPSDVVIFQYMECSAQDLLDDNANHFYFSVDCSYAYYLKKVCFSDVSSPSMHKYSEATLNIPAEWSTPTAGYHEYEYDISISDLNYGASVQVTNNFDAIEVHIQLLADGYRADELIYTDLQINPEYFEVEEEIPSNYTVYANQTITSYVPYIQSITPYSVHKVMMGVGGVLIIIVGLIASPLPIGEAFDGIFPINSITKRRGARYGKVKNK